MFRLKYNITTQPGTFTNRDLVGAPVDTSLSDAILVQSLMWDKNNQVTHAFASVDGRTGQELPPDDVFEAWVCMANHLAQTHTNPGERKLCEFVINMMRAAKNNADPYAAIIPWGVFKHLAHTVSVGDRSHEFTTYMKDGGFDGRAVASVMQMIKKAYNPETATRIIRVK